jgi:hypothetical protein
MLTWTDCVELSELTEEEVDAIAQHEHIPEMIALEMGNYLIHTPSGEKRVKAMIRDDIALASRYGLDEMLFEHEPSGRLATLSRALHFWRRFSQPEAVRLRLALEALGRSSSSSARCCPRAATCCGPTSPTNWPSCRIACRPFPPNWRWRRSRRPTAGRQPKCLPSSTRCRWPAPRSPRCISPVCDRRRRPRSSGQDPAPEHARRHRPRLWRCSIRWPPGREGLVGRQAA